ncbi:hypothetical protein CP985_10355 [Malaciobacter mytili LMG 24559]|uniref:Uncharacterized protein n=1 Tax=Malaciobacter mytili LMG 24559 TaxID=1032238 RepID=A0AAX2ADJ1_9BACT|nr:hypothetical protein [Malaciobacter mytili]RXK15097.1 hypothetical protein CP985_10355 [Malaciobacter mytili LMG 24559]
MTECAIRYFEKKDFSNIEKLISTLERLERKRVLNILISIFGVSEVIKCIEQNFIAIGLKKTLLTYIN